LFQPSGPLGNYAVKVRLAYMLGWFDRDFYDDLLAVAKIRNRFAHEIEAKDFSDQRIDAWLKGMKVYKFLPGIFERAQERRDLAAALIAKHELEDAQSSFRFCIDVMIHQLDKCAVDMRKLIADVSTPEGARDDKPTSS
jgi:hypothetical protein